MNFLRAAALWLASFAVATVIVVVSCYLAASLVVAYLKLTGAVEGERMFHDFRTPSWAGLLAYQAVSVAILGAGFFIRARLARLSGPRAPPAGP